MSLQLYTIEIMVIVKTKPMVNIVNLAIVRVRQRLATLDRPSMDGVHLTQYQG